MVVVFAYLGHIDPRIGNLIDQVTVSRVGTSVLMVNVDIEVFNLASDACGVLLVDVIKTRVQDMPAYLYYAPPVPPEKGRPGVVVLHAFNQKPEDVERYSMDFATRGMVVLAPKYTDASDGVATAIRALRRLKSITWVDPERVGLFGISLGGTVSLLASTQENVRFVVDVAGWVDLADLYVFLSKFPKGSPQKYIADLVKSTLGEPEENRELYSLASPITYVDGITGSVLIIHGSKDEMVSLSQSQLLYNKLKELGHDVELVVIEGGGYLLVGKEEDVINATYSFLSKREIVA